jgi:hypothetical protein
LLGVAVFLCWGLFAQRVGALLRADTLANNPQG